MGDPWASVDPAEVWEALGTMLERPAWHADAACREHPEVNFFAGVGEDVGPAKALCGRCLARGDCLDAALRLGESDGIWGGTSPKERRQLRRARRNEAA